LVLEEEAQEHSKTKLEHPMQCVLEDMCQKLVPILPPNKTSQGGLCQKQADPIMKLKSPIEIKLMTLGLQLENNPTLKTEHLVKLILAQLVEKLLRD